MDLLELGKTPITADNPAGDDVRYEPEFEDLQKELDKLAMASADGGGIDWQKVVNLSSSILAGKSKNIQVATYLAAAWLETSKFQGLSQGLTVIKDLVDNFWETMYPPVKRLRGRFNAISWWLDRVTPFLQKYDGDPLPGDQVRAVRGMFIALDQSLSEKADDAPMLNRLVEFVDRLPVREEAAPAAAEPVPPAGPAPTAEAPTAPAPAAPPNTTPAAAPAPTAPAPTAQAPKAAVPTAPAQAKPQSSQEAQQALDDNLTNLARISWYLMDQDPASPLPYHLARIAAWVTVDQLPMANAGQTMLPAPDGLIRGGLDSLMAAKDYLGAVKAAEARVTEFLFWLDMSRISAQAMAELGGQYLSAQEAIIAQTAMYIRRLPGLENLAFRDGTPFADRETKAWLKSISSGPGSQPAAALGPGTEAEAAEALTQALSLVKDKKTMEALGLLEQRLAGSDSARSRLLWRMTLVRLLLNLARPDLARAHLKVIMAQLDDFRVEEWEPRLAVQALRLVYEGLSDAEDEAGQVEARKTADRLAGLSPSEALNIFKG